MSSYVQVSANTSWLVLVTKITTHTKITTNNNNIHSDPQTTTDAHTDLCLRLHYTTPSIIHSSINHSSFHPSFIYLTAARHPMHITPAMLLQVLSPQDSKSVDTLPRQTFSITHNSPHNRFLYSCG